MRPGFVPPIRWVLVLALLCRWAPSAKAGEPTARPTVCVAGVVLKWVRGDKEANWRRAEPMIREAAAGGARIICTTECFLDGYAIADKSIPLEAYRALGEPIPGGKYYRRLADLAASLKVHLVAGLLEADGEARYNTAAVIGPDGKLVGKYRKQKLGHEVPRNTPGDRPGAFETPPGRAGLMICADRTDAKIVARTCAKGADFLLCPSGGMFGPKSNDPIVQARSRENKVPIVFVHPAEFLVTGEDGAVLSRTILGDTLVVRREEVGTARDTNKVFYFDLPVKQAAKVFRAGAHAENTNPTKYPVSVNGGMADRQAKGAHDPLHARCLVLDDGKTKLALCVVDACMIPREIIDEAKRLVQKSTGIPPSHVLISATHAHTAPTLTGVFQSDPDEPYVKELPGRIAQGIRRAFDNLEPAKVGWGAGKNDRQVFNRRWYRQQALIPRDPFGRTTDKVQMNPGYKAAGLEKPAGPIDPTVSLLSVQAADGRPIALLANYSLHYVGGVEPLSADYFGAFSERVKQQLEAKGAKVPFVGIMSNGTSGNANNVNYGEPAPAARKPGEQIRVVAHDVAGSALEAYRKIEHRDGVTLDAAVEEIDLGVRLPDKKDLERAKEVLAKAKGPELRGLEEVYARETVLLAKYPPRVKLVLQALRVGDLGISAIPCEVFAEIGLELRKNSPHRQTFTIELANGYNGYLPTPSQHALGGYETWRARSSYLEVDASTHITKVMQGLLKKVHQSR